MYKSGFGLLGLFAIFAQSRPILIRASEFLPKPVPNLKIFCPSPKKIQAGLGLLGLSPPKLHPTKWYQH